MQVTPPSPYRSSREGREGNGIKEGTKLYESWNFSKLSNWLFWCVDARHMDGPYIDTWPHVATSSAALWSRTESLAKYKLFLILFSKRSSELWSALVFMRVHGNWIQVSPGTIYQLQPAGKIMYVSGFFVFFSRCRASGLGFRRSPWSLALAPPLSAVVQSRG